MFSIQTVRRKLCNTEIALIFTAALMRIIEAQYHPGIYQYVILTPMVISISLTLY